MEIKQWAAPPETPGGRKKTVEVIAIPTAIWSAPNTHLQHVGNQAPTTTDKPHDKTPWAGIWRENPIQQPDKQGRHVGM